MAIQSAVPAVAITIASPIPAATFKVIVHASMVIPAARACGTCGRRAPAGVARGLPATGTGFVAEYRPPDANSSLRGDREPL